MKKFAAVFPGQGSQSVGMLAGIMDEPAVAAAYAEAGEVLGYDLRALTLQGPEERLNATEVTQPAILTASVAVYRLYEAAGGAAPTAAAGHSLGEYSALVVAGVIPFADALRLVRLRGRAMQQAVPAGAGSMAAVLGLTDEQVETACAQVSTPDARVWAANYNTPGQVVISGRSAAVTAAGARLQQLQGARVVPLTVSVPSHCPLMQSAADAVAEAVAGLEFHEARWPIYCNWSAAPTTAGADLKAGLIKQLVQPVRWAQTIAAMRAAGTDLWVEMGPGRVLTGMLRRIDRQLRGCNIADAAGLQKALTQVA